MVSVFWIFLRKTFAIFLIFVGILGLFLPILQGILLIAIGLFFWDGERFGNYLNKALLKIKLKKENKKKSIGNKK